MSGTPPDDAGQIGRTRRPSVRRPDLGPIGAVVRHELRVMRSDAAPMLVVAVMPLLLATFLRPTLQIVDTSVAAAGGNGSESAVPAMGLVMFRAVAIGVSVGLLGLRIRGPALLLPLTVVPFAAMLVAFSFALVALCRSIRQLNAFASVTTLLLSGLAGVLTPVRLLPGWAQAIAPRTPAYRALEGLKAVFVDVDAVSTSIEASVVLLAYAAGFATIGLTRFRVADRKVYAA